MKDKTHFVVAGVAVTLYRQPRAVNLSAYFTVNKKRHRVTLGTPHEAAARQEARELVIKHMGEPVNQPVDSKTFAGFVESYLPARWPGMPANDLSLRNARSRLRGMAKTEGRQVIASMTYQDAVALTQRILNRRTNGRTAIGDREALRQFWRWLMAEQVVDWPTNPCASDVLKIPPTQDPEPEPLSDDQARALLEAARKHPIHPMVVLCLGCGLRPAEACRVRWADIQDGFVSVTNFKGSKRRQRKVPLSSWVQAELRQIEKKGETLYRYGRDNAFHQFTELCKLTGLDASLQRCRQTACTKAILSGMKMLDYVVIFGHSLEVARKHYWQLGRADRSEAMEAIKF